MENQNKIVDVTTTEQNKNRNEAVSTELHFELLKQYAWLSSATIGAIMLLIQVKSVEMNNYMYSAVGLLTLSIFISILGQDHIVESLLKGKRIYDEKKALTIFRFSSMFCFGLGVGMFTSSFVRLL